MKVCLGLLCKSMYRHLNNQSIGNSCYFFLLKKMASWLWYCNWKNKLGQNKNFMNGCKPLKSWHWGRQYLKSYLCSVFLHASSFEWNGVCSLQNIVNKFSSAKHYQELLYSKYLSPVICISLHMKLHSYFYNIARVLKILCLWKWYTVFKLCFLCPENCHIHVLCYMISHMKPSANAILLMNSDTERLLPGMVFFGGCFFLNVVHV